MQPTTMPMMVFELRPDLLGGGAVVVALGTGGLPKDVVLVLFSKRAFTADEDHEEGNRVPLEQCMISAMYCVCQYDLTYFMPFTDCFIRSGEV